MIGGLFFGVVDSLNADAEDLIDCLGRYVESFRCGDSPLRLGELGVLLDADERDPVSGDGTFLSAWHRLLVDFFGELGAGSGNGFLE